MAVYNIQHDGPNFSIDFNQDSVDVIAADSDIFAWYLHNAWMKEPNYPGPLWIDSLHGLSHTFEEPSKGMYELAERVCSYYADRFLVAKLRNGHISKFRESAYQFVTRSNTDQMLASHTGIMAKLPDFFKYDVQVDEWEELYNMDVTYDMLDGKDEMEIEYVDTLARYISGSRVDEYWFTNSDNQLIKIPVTEANPLSNVFQRYLQEHNNTIAIDAYFYKSSTKGRDNFNYISASSWTLI